jgi:hypothetical protein
MGGKPGVFTHATRMQSCHLIVIFQCLIAYDLDINFYTCTLFFRKREVLMGLISGGILGKLGSFFQLNFL